MDRACWCIKFMVGSQDSAWQFFSKTLYLDGSFDSSLCFYYASLNFLTVVVKVFYFVGVFGLLRWVVNRLTGFRFMPEREQS